MTESILSKLIEELKASGNHDSSIARCKVIIKEIQDKMDKRVIAYFASEVSNDVSSMINDEDVFVIENLLSIDTRKRDIVLILESGGGLAISAERIIDVCRNYCAQQSKVSKFYVIVPKKAKSAATIVALGSDKIYLRATAELGPVDPQFVISDGAGNTEAQPAYLFVDALENFFDENLGMINKVFKKPDNNKPLSRLPDEMKLKLLEQCNYPVFVSAKNELGLSDSIIEKISKEKVKQYPNVKSEDFDIFRDPHITKSHGRLINLSDLSTNSLRTEKFIEPLADCFTNESKYKEIDQLIWELYVRKRQLLNDVGNQIVKTIETTDEFLINVGMKRGQTPKSP